MVWPPVFFIPIQAIENRYILKQICTTTGIIGLPNLFGPLNYKIITLLLALNQFLG